MRPGDTYRNFYFTVTSHEPRMRTISATSSFAHRVELFITWTLKECVQLRQASFVSTEQREERLARRRRASQKQRVNRTLYNGRVALLSIVYRVPCSISCTRQGVWLSGHNQWDRSRSPKMRGIALYNHSVQRVERHRELKQYTVEVGQESDCAVLPRQVSARSKTSRCAAPEL